MTVQYRKVDELIERFHQQLKAHTSHCNDALSVVILGIHDLVQTDPGCAAAGLTEGTTFRLSGKMSIHCLHLRSRMKCFAKTMGSVKPASN